MQELKRVINYKKLILIAAIALVNIIFFPVCQQTGN